MPPELAPQARTAGIVVEDFGDEALAYDLERHEAHCLSPAAAAVWRLCDGRRTVAEITARLRRGDPRFDERIVWLALERLQRARLLEALERRPQRPPARSRRELLKKAAALGGLSVLSMTVSTPALAVTCISCANCETLCDNSGLCNNTRPCCDQTGNCKKKSSGHNCGCGGRDNGCHPNDCP